MIDPNTITLDADEQKRVNEAEARIDKELQQERGRAVWRIKDNDQQNTNWVVGEVMRRYERGGWDVELTELTEQDGAGWELRIVHKTLKPVLRFKPEPQRQRP